MHLMRETDSVMGLICHLKGTQKLKTLLQFVNIFKFMVNTRRLLMKDYSLLDMTEILSEKHPELYKERIEAINYILLMLLLIR